MGCDTKGFVITKNKDVREITLRTLKVVQSIQGNSEYPHTKNANFFSTVDYRPEENFFKIDFKDGDDQRIIWVFLDCDCDLNKLGESGIIFSFGMWGNSLELMEKFLNAFQDMGDCYIQENDCGDDPVIYKN